MKNKKMKIVVGLFCSAISFSQLYAECIEGKIKIKMDGKDKESVERYCFDNNLKTLISDSACAHNKVCQSKNLGTIELKMSELAGETGALGFKICEKYHGTPQTIEYWDTKKWNPGSRCLFKDGSFIDMASMSQKVKYVD